MSTPREPLSARERALAQRLARAADAHEPGPALDARILAAARAAVDEAAQAAAPMPRLVASLARRRDRRRWTVGFGVAASLLLAVTVAWQLRPQHTSRFVHESAQAPAASHAVTKPPAPAAAERAEPAGVGSAPGARSGREDPAASARRAAPAPSAKPEPIGLPPSTPKALSPELAQRRGQDHTEPQAFAPPAQDAIAPAAQAQAPRVAGLEPRPAPAVEAGVAPPPAPMPALEAPVNHADAQRAMAQTRETPSADAVQDDPGSGNRESAPTPATTGNTAAALQSAIAQDQRLPAQDWLQRIRAHRFEGNSALARASLRAFRQAHPDAPIPEDLRPLLP